MGNSSSSSQSNTPPAEPAEAVPKPPSYYSMVKNSYQTLVNAIIRPPRSKYEVTKLGPEQFLFCGKTITRKDFTLVNPREQRFCCSMWEPIDRDRANTLLPCVIYMHGNSSSRLESLSALSLVLSLGATLLSFDFAGSGHSDGDYVTLGAFEKDDLQCVIEFLRAGGTTSTIALWGRSMGAATALLHGERDPSIAAMVLDSTFSSLVTLAEEMVEMGRKQGLFAPGFLVRIALQFVRSSVQKTAGFDIKTLTPIDSAEKCFIPALLIAAEDDHFVCKSHSEAIYDRYGGDKNLIIVDGDHNTARPRFLYDSVGIFLTQTLQIPVEWSLPDGEMYIRRLPWSYNANVTQIFSPTVTAVGTKHGRFTAPASVVTGSEAGPAAASPEMLGGKVGGTSQGTGSNGAAGNEMSFDEMLALSIMLNEGDEADYEALSLRYGPELTAQLVLNTEMYGSNYGFNGSSDGLDGDGDDEGADSAGNEGAALNGGVLGDAHAEAAMQQGVQQSLFNLMNGGSSSARNVHHDELGAGPTSPSSAAAMAARNQKTSSANASTSAGVSAAERYRQKATTMENNNNAKVSADKSNNSRVYSNQGGKHSDSQWSLSSESSAEQGSFFRDVPGTSESGTPSKPAVPAAAVGNDQASEPSAWRCSMCTMNNDRSLDTCESCGIMRGK